MNCKDTVSVVIPTWNRSVSLERAIRSALSQTYPPLEVLVCNDGSTDDSKEKIIAIGDKRVRWIDGMHSGRPAIPRNQGIYESMGTWVAFLDDDDEWLPDKLEKQLVLVSRLGCMAVCSNAYRIVPDNRIYGSLLEWSSERIVFNDLVNLNQIICSSTLIKKTLFHTVIGFPEDVHLKAWEDYALWLRIATLTDFAFVNESLLIYRDDVTNSVRNKNVDVWSLRRAVFSDLKRWVGHHGISSACLRSLRKQRLIDMYRSNRVRFMEYIAQIKEALL